MSGHEWKIKRHNCSFFMVVKWSKLFRITFYSLRVNSILSFFMATAKIFQRVQGDLLGLMQLLFREEKWCTFDLLFQKLFMHLSIQKVLWNFVNDTERNKSWPLFLKSSQLSDKWISRESQKKKEKKKNGGCCTWKMVVRINQTCWHWGKGIPKRIRVLGDNFS